VHAYDVVVGWSRSPQTFSVSSVSVYVSVAARKHQEGTYVPVFEVGMSLADSASYCVNVTDHAALERSKHRNEFVTSVIFT
jgi:hypothetical protein